MTTTLSAKTGWLWIKEAFTLFKKQPIGFNLLFLAYFFLMQLISVIPVIKILSLATLPLFSMAFMQACRDVRQGQRITAKSQLAALRQPSTKPLLILGVLYPIVALAALAVSALVDGGLLWSAAVGNGVDVQEIPDSNILNAVLVSFLVCIPAAMAFWYAAPLVAWQNMPVTKALFYSFFAVYRSGRAFIVYLIGWFVISIVLPSIVCAFIAITFGLQAAFAIALPTSIILTVVIYCSFYPTYTSVFDDTAPPSKAVVENETF
jgi:hypothetical protein